MSTADVADPFALVGTTLEGRFVVDRVVAEGGFGVVYHAQQAALERSIALKVLKTPKQFDEEARQHFLNGFAAEAKTIARISHPHIVQVFDFGVSAMPTGGRAAWMALEWLTGKTLEDDLASRRGQGGRSPAECLAVLRPILGALAVVHREGVAHRDIKPANIMILATHTGSMLKLLDFGIAKIMDANEAPGTGQTRTRSNLVAFSPGYAAPEQIAQGRSGPWTDVHALALVVSEMLTDSPPFVGDEMAVLFQQIVDRERPTPAKRGVHVGSWNAVLARALAVAPGDRYRDAGEFLHALESTVASAAHAPMTASGAMGEPSRETLAAMSTQMAPAARAPVTTHTPISQDDASSIPVRRGTGVWRWAVGLGAGGVLLGGAGWLALARGHSAPPTTTGLATSVVAAPVATGGAVPAPPMSPPASSPPIVLPVIPPSPIPSAAASPSTSANQHARHTPPHAVGSTAPTPKPATSGSSSIVIE